VEKSRDFFFTFSENGLHYISTDEVGNTAAFLVSPLASAITGSTIYVDNGLNTMGLALDSPTLST
jgi:enoyl-[acyl-carrier-protein] reductase (NADH)